tara:strand:+ start:3413 stop:4294 length:882 start_codon:yes stop_codon:yes gene_type:complete
MPNKRIHFGLQQATIGGSVVRGAQSVGFDISPDFLDVVNYGQEDLLRIFEDKSSGSFTVQRFLYPGFSALWGSSIDALPIGVGGLTESNVGIVYSGGDGFTASYSLIDSIEYNFSSDGFFTESVTFSSENISSSSGFSATSESGEVCRRANFTSVTLPTEVSSAAVSDGATGYLITSASISASIGYGEITSYGNKPQGSVTNKFKHLELPIEVESSVTVVIQNSVIPAMDRFENWISGGVPNKALSFVTCGKTFSVGSKNFLSGISLSGGDASGGNVEATFTYRNKHGDFTIT